MAYNVKFLKGTSVDFAGLSTKDVNTFYFIDGQDLYLGSIKLSNASDLAAAIIRLTTAEGKINTNTSSISSQATEIANIKATLSALTGGDEESGTITDMIDAAVEEALGAIPEGKTVKEYIDQAIEDSVYDDTALKARVKTNEDAIAVLNGTEEGSVAKQVADAVAAIVAEAPEAYDTLKEISDWISSHADSASAMNTQITANKTDIAALKALVGELPEGTDSETIVAYIEEKVAGVKDWTSDIATAKTEAVNTAKQYAKDYADGLADNYATAEQGAKADSAVQSIEEGSENGTISVDGEDVAVHGLGSAAYAEAEDFDIAGSASAALTSAKAYTDTALSWGTIA